MRKYVSVFIISALLSITFSCNQDEPKNRFDSLIKKFQENNKKKLVAGDKAPDFSVTDINGNLFSLQGLKGKVVVINCWFIACHPCVQEIPEISAIAEKYKEKNVVFIGLTPDGKTEVEVFLKTHEFKYNIVPESKETIKKFNVFIYPTNIVIGKNSKIAYSDPGFDTSIISHLDKIIDSLTK